MFGVILTNRFSCLQLQNNEFCKEKRGSGASAAEREKMLVELAAAHDAFMETVENLKAGEKFYNGLTEVRIIFIQKLLSSSPSSFSPSFWKPYFHCRKSLGLLSGLFLLSFFFFFFVIFLKRALIF